MKEYRAADIRNVALVAHSGVGKTTLGEAMLFAAGAISRMGRVDDGTSTSDYEPEEVKRKVSINLSLLPLEWKGRKVNLLDTPGYYDFVGEVKSGLRAADTALVVVDAVSGVQVGTELVWGYADEGHLPRLVFVNRMDRENADFLSVVSQLQSMYGQKCLPVQLPVGSQSAFKGVVDLLAMKAYLGEDAKETDIPDDLASQVETYREKLIEVIAETDDDLVMKYLEGEDLTPEEMVAGLKAGIARGTIVPILAGSALANIGTARLLDFLVEFAPSPVDLGPVTTISGGSDGRLAPDAAGPLAALVFKTTADPYVGRLSYFRVYSGVLTSNSQVWNGNKGCQERIGQLFVVRGRNQDAAAQIGAGDIGAVAKLAETATGDTLCQQDNPIVLPGITFPPTSYDAAVFPKTKADLDKMGVALARIVDEDPSLRIRREQETAETIISGIGETHIDVAIEKIRRKFGVDLETSLPRVPYRETVSSTATADYLHKKQTGGHGQYARVALELVPLPRGSGFEFTDRIVGGVVPKNYIPSVEKGVIEASQEGVVAGYPLVDVRVTLYDGKHHEVDSSDIAFKIAAAAALKRAVQQARPVLLEPIVNLKVTVPDAYTGEVINDLTGKRGRVQGMTPHDGMTTIEAQVPLAEIQRYSTDLRSITQGRGTFTTEFSHYEEVPDHLAQKIVAQSQKETARV